MRDASRVCHVGDGVGVPPEMSNKEDLSNREDFEDGDHAKGKQNN
jgi:hypothetical protein